ncbi:alpha/beta fold hydrolase [Bdellovibrio sp. HCB274]|uniref:alpha/beta fold hydrolase n=1 Tax=Bdellovibrio sp. HCB274 TaxID=3394361 RepID=UPI0039B5A669
MQKPKKWILIRGLARGKGHWGSFPQKMQKFFPNDQIEMIDLPGNGERNQEQSPLAISEYVADLRQQSQFVKQNESFHLLGISLGAMIAVQWLNDHPQEVEKAHLICTSSASTSAFYQRYQLRNYLPTLRLFFAAKDPELYEQTVLAMTTNDFARRQAELPGLVEYSRKYPELRGNVVRQLLAASRFQVPKNLPKSVNLLGSFGDGLVSPHCTLQLGKLWGVEPKMHDAAGHDLPIDDPQWVLEQLL